MNLGRSGRRRGDRIENASKRSYNSEDEPGSGESPRGAERAPACVPACQPAYQSVYQSAYQSAYQPACRWSDLAWILDRIVRVSPRFAE